MVTHQNFLCNTSQNVHSKLRGGQQCITYEIMNPPLVTFLTSYLTFILLVTSDIIEEYDHYPFIEELFGTGDFFKEGIKIRTIFNIF